jgi:2,3,4,5-tetrahydropyridine-2-carboxylate N-succinyltransferase
MTSSATTSLNLNMSTVINTAFESNASTWNDETKQTIHSVISLLDSGKLRIAEPTTTQWKHNSWVQKAILCYFKLTNNWQQSLEPLHFQDKIHSKFTHTPINQLSCRVVPPSHVRYGAHIGNQCVLMPCFVNIGAFIDDYTMIDTWATIGSGAQIGKHVHISGGVGIGGVLEPVQAKPTIIEDHCFIGARSEIAEGILIQKGAVIAMGTFISQSTKIYDRTTGTISYGTIPENAVVVPGSLPSQDNTHQLNAAIIVKYADKKTRSKTSINDILRDF